MTAAQIETVAMSHLMSDLPAAPAVVRQAVAAPLLRALDLVKPTPAVSDFADTDEAGHTESLNAWSLRVFGEA